MSTREKRLSLTDGMALHNLMKDYIVLSDEIGGIRYVDYKIDWNDDRMARLATEKIGRRVTAVQVRNLRQDAFGMRRKPRPRPMPELVAAATLDELDARMDLLEAGLKKLTEYQNTTRTVLWNKYNELLAHVRALDAEWGTCRPANYKPGLPEIINDTDKGAS